MTIGIRVCQFCRVFMGVSDERDWDTDEDWIETTGVCNQCHADLEAQARREDEVVA